MKLHVAYLSEQDSPMDTVETIARRHDGPVGEALADRRYILVEDRAYFKIERIDQFVEDGQLFVIWMKDNVEMYRRKSLQRWVSNDSNILVDFTCQLGTKQYRSQKRHRVVMFQDTNEREIRMVTNMLNVSAEKIADMYRERWAIKVFFLWVKQYLNVPTLFGTMENAVYNQPTLCRLHRLRPASLAL